MYFLLILIDKVVQSVATHYARGIHSIRTYNAHHRVVIVHVCQPLQVLLRELPFVIIVHIAHIGLVHGEFSLPAPPKLGLCPAFPSLILPGLENVFDIVLHPCQCFKTKSGRDAVRKAGGSVAAAGKWVWKERRREDDRGFARMISASPGRRIRVGNSSQVICEAVE